MEGKRLRERVLRDVPIKQKRQMIEEKAKTGEKPAEGRRFPTALGQS